MSRYKFDPLEYAKEWIAYVDLLEADPESKLGWNRKMEKVLREYIELKQKGDDDERQ